MTQVGIYLKESVTYASGAIDPSRHTTWLVVVDSLGELGGQVSLCSVSYTHLTLPTTTRV